ncbi:acylphosphatase [Silvimonas sp. JCM 19000]
MSIAKRLVVHGRVQGVGFRYATCLEAKRLGLGGWVRNRQDGSVEILVEGPADAVDEMVDWASRGPELADVTRLDISGAVPENSGEFEERATG